MRARTKLDCSIVAVDADSYKIAAVISNDGTHQLFTAKLSGTISDRCYQAHGYISQLVRDIRGPVAVFVETPVFARGGIKALLPLARVNGAILAGVRENDPHTLCEVAVAAWKKEVVGSGNASKFRIQVYLRGHWRKMYSSAKKEKGFTQDLMDAACIWQYGERFMRRLVDKL